MSEGHPKLVEELVPKILSLGEVQKVLQQLLREQVSVRDLSTILEALLDTAGSNKHPLLLVEAARQALGRALVRPLLSDDGGLRVLTLDHSIEEELSRAFNLQAVPATNTGLQPSFVRRILDGLRQIAGDQVAQTGASHPSLRYTSALSFTPPAGTFSPEGSRPFATGDSADGLGAVAGNGAVKKQCDDPVLVPPCKVFGR